LNNYLPNRKRTRHKDHDYTSSGYYFITICIANQKYKFGNIKNGTMVLNKYGLILEKCWNDLPNHYNCSLDFFSIMPDHFHGIIQINKSAKPENVPYSLSEIVRGLKTFSSKNINAEIRTSNKFKWQKSFYDRVIRNEKELYQIRKYIEQNPIKWDLANQFPENVGNGL